jgi:hypothetical protein
MFFLVIVVIFFGNNIFAGVGQSITFPDIGLFLNSPKLKETNIGGKFFYYFYDQVLYPQEFDIARQHIELFAQDRGFFEPKPENSTGAVFCSRVKSPFESYDNTTIIACVFSSKADMHENTALFTTVLQMPNNLIFKKNYIKKSQYPLKINGDEKADTIFTYILKHKFQEYLKKNYPNNSKFLTQKIWQGFIEAKAKWLESWIPELKNRLEKAQAQNNKESAVRYKEYIESYRKWATDLRKNIINISVEKSLGKTPWKDWFDEQKAIAQSDETCKYLDISDSNIIESRKFKKIIKKWIDIGDTKALEKIPNNSQAIETFNISAAFFKKLANWIGKDNLDNVRIIYTYHNPYTTALLTREFMEIAPFQDPKLWESLRNYYSVLILAFKKSTNLNSKEKYINPSSNVTNFMDSCLRSVDRFMWTTAAAHGFEEYVRNSKDPRIQALLPFIEDYGAEVREHFKKELEKYEVTYPDFIFKY